MASNTPAPKTATKTNRPAQAVQQTITLELVVALAPHTALANNLSRTFGLDDIDYDGIREATEEHVALAAKVLEDVISEKALEIHLQRIVGSFVNSAHGAAQFYSSKVTEARQLTMASENDDRDEDRDGPAGFDSKADRARDFAARVGLQSYALLAAAEGAVHAYAAITGQDWKPYVRSVEAPRSVARRAASVEIDAFKK